MKKRYLSRMTILSVFLFSSLFIAGCGGSGGGTAPAVNTHVIVQLQTAGSHYLVDGMTVSIQKVGGSVVLTGVTGTNGIVSIPVAHTGDYHVIQVDGVDSTTLVEGSEAGREFVKSNPIANPYPNLTYTFGGSFPTVSVTALGSDYMVNATVPSINKVIVIKVDSVTSAADGTSTVQAGMGSFMGRVMISNISSSDANLGLRIVSNINSNRLMLYGNSTAMTDTYFYGGVPDTQTHTGFIDTYNQTGPIYFEASGTDSGDWALGYNLTTTQMKTRGIASQYTNFPGFDGGISGSHSVLSTWSTVGGSGHTYKYDYRIFGFVTYGVII
jgi:hypothetical protein